MKKNGFVLVETIVVILVLCVLLIMLYGGYMNVISAVQRKSYYDNTEYIYKTNLVKEYLESSNFSGYEGAYVYMYCQGSSDCLGKGDAYFKAMVSNMHINSIYITKWYTSDLSVNDLSSLEATTQNYIKKLDPTSDSGYRIIVMFEDENNYNSNPTIYQYASLRFGDSDE